jgi:hypothetical protein
MDVLPQIFAGGELGHDPFGAGSVGSTVGDGLVVVGSTVGDGLVVVGSTVGDGLVVVGSTVGDGLAVVGSTVGDGLVVVGSTVGDGSVGSGVVAVGVGEGVVCGVVPLLMMVKSPRRLEVWPSDHFRTALMVCDPSGSFVVSYGTAVPSAAVPARSKGAALSVRMGCFVP